MIFSSGSAQRNSTPLASIRSDSSSRTCLIRLPLSTGPRFMVTAPLVALLTSNKSSISTFRRMDFWSST